MLYTFPGLVKKIILTYMPVHVQTSTFQETELWIPCTSVALPHVSVGVYSGACAMAVSVGVYSGVCAMAVSVGVYSGACAMAVSVGVYSGACAMAGAWCVAMAPVLTLPHSICMC